MKAALFTDSYLPATDGVVSSILAYRGGLKEKGHRWYIFAPEAQGAKPERGVYRYKSITFPPYPQYRAAIFPYVSGGIAKKTGVQLVHSKAMATMALAAISFASRCRLPSIASLETMIPDGVHYIIKNEGAQQIGRKIAWGYLRWLYSNFDIVTAPSKHTQGLLAQNRVESEVLPSPVDASFFKPNRRGESVKKEFGIPGKKLVLSVGRIVKEKDYSFLVKAAKAMRDPDVYFLIMGRGPYLEELQKEIDKEGVQERMRIEGSFFDRKRLVDIYNAGDAFAFASQFETQGLVHLEAMACGTPACVLSGTAPAEAIADGKNGYVFSHDPKDCAEKLARCIERKGKLAHAARKTVVNNYSIPLLSEKLAEKYRRLLK